MDQHAIPRQITNFEFKLIGFLTIKQFIYILIFVGIGLATYFIVPIPVINVFLGIIVVSIGPALAFIPINDRPLEVWLRNLIKRLFSPTQYKFQKNNPPLAVLQNNLPNNSSTVSIHLDSQQKLSSYLSKNNSDQNSKKQSINDLFQNPITSLFNGKSSSHQPMNNQPLSTASDTQNLKEPFISGIVKNHNLTSLSGILIYIKKADDTNPLRILKTNINGIFATFRSLPEGEYFFDIKDPKETYLFDTIKVKIENSNSKPFEIISKELI
jgi:hypothetical protein